MTTETTAGALYARALQNTAARPDRCVVPWGVCPDHGGTLGSSAGRSWCTDLACLNTWDYDRLDAACPEKATHTVQAADGRYVVCAGHAVAARSQITDAQVLTGTRA